MRQTSGSVNERAIAIIPDDRSPSVKMGPRRCCMLGVRRNGTISLVANIGA